MPFWPSSVSWAAPPLSVWPLWGIARQAASSALEYAYGGSEKRIPPPLLHPRSLERGPSVFRPLLNPDLVEEHAVEEVELHVSRAGGGHDDVPTRGEGNDGRALRDLALDPLPCGLPSAPAASARAMAVSIAGSQKLERLNSPSQPISARRNVAESASRRSIHSGRSEAVRRAGRLP